MTLVAPQVDAVKQWLLERNPELEDIDPQLDLIENRVIDSLRLVEFVFFLEELTERDIEVSDELVDSLRTLTSIEARILRAGAA